MFHVKHGNAWFRENINHMVSLFLLARGWEYSPCKFVYETCRFLETRIVIIGRAVTLIKNQRNA
jgi:hypothetical protein